MIKFILALLLVNPTTGVERTTFVIVDTEQQCTAMKANALNPEHAKMRKQHHPDTMDVKAVQCNPIDMSNHSFSQFKDGTYAIIRR